MSAATKDITKHGKIQFAESAPAEKELMRSFASQFLNSFYRFNTETQITAEIQYVSGTSIWSVFDRMPLRDGRLASNTQARINGVRAVEFTLNPFDDSPQSIAMHERIYPLFFSNKSYAKIAKLFECLMYGILHGTRYIEIEWMKDRDGFYMPADYKLLHGKRMGWTIDEGYHLLDGLVKIPIPDYKILIQHGEQKPEQPFGIGLYHKAFWGWWLKTHVEKFWSIYCEKFGMPTVVGEFAPGTSTEDKNQLLQACQSIQTDTSIVKSERMKINYLEAMRQGSPEYKAVTEYCDQENDLIFRGESMVSTAHGTGSYAQARVADGLRLEVAENDFLDLQANLQQVVDWIAILNFGTAENAPTIEPSLKRRQNPIDLATWLKGAQDLGLTLDKEDTYDRFGLPIPEEGQGLVAPQKPQSIPFQFSEPPADPEDALESAEVKSLDRFENMIAKMADTASAAVLDTLEFK